jgi:hypothetical protein
MEKYYYYFSDLIFLELIFLTTTHDKASNSFECMEKVLQFFRFTFFLDFFFQTTSHVKASNPFECTEEWHIGAQSVGELPYLEKF